jgi:hypothetical protein
MFQDQILRFLDSSAKWGEDVVISNDFALNQFPGNPIDCFLFERDCNIDEMESEDDEKYVFSTPDYKVRTKLNRFQTRIILKQMNPVVFDDNRIDLLIRLAWNWPKLAINKTNAQYEPYNDSNDNLSPSARSVSGGPPVRTVYIEE